MHGMHSVARSRSIEMEANVVMDVAETTSRLRRNTIDAQHNNAAHRLRDRLLERRGLMSSTVRQQNKRKMLQNKHKIQPSFNTLVDDVITSHRIEAEAACASRNHLQMTLKRQSMSNIRVRVRVAARETAKRLRCLQACPVFASLTEASISMIVDAMDYEVAEGGQVLCQEGREADKMYLLMSGACEVFLGEAQNKVAQLEELAVFGEAALFPDEMGTCVRTATVRVAAGEAPAQLLVLPKSALQNLLESGAMGDSCVEHLTSVAEARRLGRERFAHNDGAVSPLRSHSKGGPFELPRAESTA